MLKWPHIGQPGTLENSIFLYFIKMRIDSGKAKLNGPSEKSEFTPLMLITRI